MINRRNFFALGSAALASCTPSRDFLGSTAPPSSQRLVFALGEPSTLDPAKSSNTWEVYVIPALFEGLTQVHPELPDPMAALATHYQSSRDETRFTFYLRGHESPRGVRLPGYENLPVRFTRGRKAGPVSQPALWSDGTVITAHDFVYSWQRFMEPETAAPFAYQLFCIKNAEEIYSGKRASIELGVRALGNFVLDVELRSPSPFFLRLITQWLFAAVPRHVIEKAGSGWTEPRHIVTSGPFTLGAWRRHEALTLVKNPRYYDRDLVALDELTFCSTGDETTTVNLYKAGAIAATTGSDLPALLLPVLSQKRDYRVQPAFAAIFSAMNTRRPPFNELLLRYALNMATNKTVLAGFLAGGRIPARSVVPPFAGYAGPARLPIDIDSRAYDVLAFDPQGAQALFARAVGPVSLEFTYHFPSSTTMREMAEILQQQWQSALKVRVKLAGRENNVHWKMILDADYSGVAYFAIQPGYMDPTPFFDPFLKTTTANPSAWADTNFTSKLSEANAITSPEERMRTLAHCEELLLTAMPVLPLYFDTWRYLMKPYVHGLSSNAFDLRSFKYVWIDTHWRAS
jgi:oligopeptide transport system substrate-binding protein